MSVSLDNNLVFIDFVDIFHFLSSSLNCLVKYLDKNSLKYLSHEFSSEVLYLVKQKTFYPYEYMSSFEKFNKTLPNRRQFYI